MQESETTNDADFDYGLRTLMVQAQNGDSASYTELLQVVSVVLRKYLSRRIADSVAREDVLQEILVSLHKARHTYDPNLPFQSWMYAIARFRLIDFYRRSKRQRDRERFVEGLEEIVRAEESEEPRFDAQELSLALKELPAAQREAVERLKLRDQSVKEAALSMDRTESSVKVLAHRGYKALRKILSTPEVK